MKVAILGGSGFIGSHLTKHLIHKGHQVIIWSRNPEKIETENSALEVEKWPLEGISEHQQLDAVINLAGETINQRWTTQAKERIINSRVKTTSLLLKAVEKGYITPKILINGSAVGYYGTSTDYQFTEKDSQSGDDFLSKVTTAWEQEADKATNLGLRLVKTRFGVVLGRDGGALSSMLLPYKLFVGGRVGSGQQWLSWVHVKEVVELITFALENEKVEGVLNCTSPHPVRMNEFGKVASKTLKRPHWLPAPGFALKIILGEMSDLILKGQKVYPQKAIDMGYQFNFPTLEEALEDLV
jgi:uncharacterized protein (TIGR01777 family)